MRKKWEIEMRFCAAHQKIINLSAKVSFSPPLWRSISRTFIHFDEFEFWASKFHTRRSREFVSWVSSSIIYNNYRTSGVSLNIFTSGKRHVTKKQKSRHTIIKSLHRMFCIEPFWWNDFIFDLLLFNCLHKDSHFRCKTWHHANFKSSLKRQA